MNNHPQQWLAELLDKFMKLLASWGEWRKEGTGSSFLADPKERKDQILPCLCCLVFSPKYKI